jgi:hypothetical protein
MHIIYIESDINISTSVQINITFLNSLQCSNINLISIFIVFIIIYINVHIFLNTLQLYTSMYKQILIF